MFNKRKKKVGKKLKIDKANKHW